MNLSLEKMAFFISLTKDNDFSFELLNNVVDYYLDDDTYNMIINLSRGMYVTYSLKYDEEDKSVIHINKNLNDIESDIKYTLELRKIIDRTFCDLFRNSDRVIRYEFNDDVINKNNVGEWKIVNCYDYYEQKNTGRSK